MLDTRALLRKARRVFGCVDRVKSNPTFFKYSLTMLVLRVWFGLCLGKRALLQPRGSLCSGCTDGPAHPHAAQFLLLRSLNDRYFGCSLASYPWLFALPTRPICDSIHRCICLHWVSAIWNSCWSTFFFSSTFLMCGMYNARQTPTPSTLSLQKLVRCLASGRAHGLLLHFLASAAHQRCIKKTFAASGPVSEKE